MKTIYADPSTVQRNWYVVDAEGVVLGRLATKVASVLRGKHKPEFHPSQDLGDFVVVVNADKIRVTGNKLTQKMYYRHSGYPGGIKSETLQKVLKRAPERPVERAIRGMLPKNRLGRKLFTHLKVYAGPNHPHGAQKPQPLEIEGE